MEYEGNAIGSVHLFVCLSVTVRNSTIIAMIDLIFVHNKDYTRGLAIV